MFKDHQGQMVRKGQLEIEVIRDHKEYQDHQVVMDSLETRVIKDQLVKRGQKEMMERKVVWEPRVILDLEDLQDYLDLKVRLRSDFRCACN